MHEEDAALSRRVGRLQHGGKTDRPRGRAHLGLPAERSELRLRARASLLSLGGRMAGDPRLQGKIDGWVEGAAAYVVTTYQTEIISLITDTVAGWDAEHTSRKIEAHIGRDLQFIRINGTVVGALAGVALHAVEVLVA